MGNVMELSRTIGSSYNQYFTWNNNSAFYMKAPPYLYQFYNTQVFTWDEWNNGWVENFHNITKGLLPTQFAGSLCHKVADLIYGDGVLFESLKDKNEPNDALDFIDEQNIKTDLKTRFKDSILKSAQLGNALLKINSDENADLWVDALAGNRFFVAQNSRGEIVKTLSYVNIYTNGVPSKSGKNVNSYALCEERFYEQDENGEYTKDVYGKKKPMAVYRVYQLTGPANVFKPEDASAPIPFDDLPSSVRRAFREEYGNLMLNEPQELPLENLGCYLVKHTEYVTGMPNIKLGESCLAKIINYLPKYDAIDSEETIDLRISRPKIIIPDFMQKGKNGSDEMSAVDGVIFERVETKSDAAQTPISFIPNPREEHFIRLKEDVIKKICGQLGIATSSLFSDIADARGVVTAREIDSETSNTALYISNKRQLLEKPFNDCIRDILKYYGYEPVVRVAFAPAGSSNKSVMVENTVKLMNAGLQSEYQSVKELHPNWTDTQIAEELDEIHEAKQKQQEQFIGGLKNGENEGKQPPNEEDNKNTQGEDKQADKQGNSTEK